MAPDLSRPVAHSLVPSVVRATPEPIGRDLRFEEKGRIRAFWEERSCGERYARGATPVDRLRALAAARYGLEPYIVPFARFDSCKDRDVLEIGVGMGCDHVRLAAAGPRSLHGVDLTERAIGFTAEQLEYFGLSSSLQTADAESLPFSDESFDIVYSFGVLHHTPDTSRAIREVHRVLRPGGQARIMIYHRSSITGYMLWTRCALLAGHPFRSLHEIYARHLESPGTKAYSVDEARRLFSGFSKATVSTQLNHGDLLLGEVGQRHRGWLLSLAKSLWPRWFIRRVLREHGLYLMIHATK